MLAAATVVSIDKLPVAAAAGSAWASRYARATAA